MTVGSIGASDDGNTAGFSSYSPLPGSTHGMPISKLAHRGADGWTSVVASPKPITPNYNAITGSSPINVGRATSRWAR